jgi:hypothetical protein
MALLSGRVHLESDYFDAQTAEQIEGAVQLRLIKQRTAQHRSGRDGLLFDIGEAQMEVLIQSSLDPTAKAPIPRLAVLVLLLHIAEYQDG